MSIDGIKGLKSFSVIPHGGVNEISSAVQVPLSNFLKLENFRPCLDGIGIEKRSGLAEIEHTAFGGKDIYGYSTYYNSDADFCQLVVTEDKVYRKIASAAWSAIHTWASNITHPVKIHNIQGKQIMITDVENIMVLPSGSVVTVGIAAPATLPTLAASFESGSLDLDEDCADISDWTDADEDGATSSQATYDGKSCMKFLTTGTWAAQNDDIAIRHRTLNGLASSFPLELSIYINAVENKQYGNKIVFKVYTGDVLVRITLDQSDMYVYNGSKEIAVGMSIPKGEWVTFNFNVNCSDPSSATVECIKNGKSFGTMDCSYANGSNAGKVQIEGWGKAADSNCTQFHIDYIKLGAAQTTTSPGEVAGTVRYAITYERNGGNYPNESDPIKSLIGAPSAMAGGVTLDDLTASGTYTGSDDKTIRVQIDSAGATDTMKWSADGGTTWNSTGIPLTTTMYLPYGIVLTWGATTGHAADDYWDIDCDACSISCSNQKVTLSSIPVSSDSQVTRRNIYRTLAGGATYYLLAVLNDNTTTSYVDNTPDTILAYGTLLAEDNEQPPLGKYSVWWKDALWVVDEDENIVYRSKVAVPEAFDATDRFVSVRTGEPEDEITGLYPYNGVLYVFKRNSIYAIQRALTSAYSVAVITTDFGCIAPWSILEVNNKLMFLSFRGWEQFDGAPTDDPVFSLPITTSINTIDKTATDYITAVKHPFRNEVWLSVPDRTGTYSAVTMVCNLSPLVEESEGGSFYFFSFHKVPSCIVQARDSSKETQIIMGTRDGYLFTAESGDQDGSTNISASARIPWATYDRYGATKLAEFEYEAPTDKTITIAFYVNQDKDAGKTVSLAGNTPTATDRAYRKTIKCYNELDLNGRYLGVSIANAENTGADLKIKRLSVFYDEKDRKGTIQAD